MIKVILESPFAGFVERNKEYARKCMRDSLLRGESPLASHLLYTQKGILDDTEPEERALGIEAGLVWGTEAEKTVVYTDFGVSKGMEYGISRAQAEGRPIEYRSILCNHKNAYFFHENAPAHCPDCNQFPDPVNQPS